MTRPNLMFRAADWLLREPYTGWRFGDSVGLEGLLAMGGDFQRRAVDLLGRWVSSAPSFPVDPTAHVAPGLPLVQALPLLPAAEQAFALGRAEELADAIAALPRGRHGARLHRSDLPDWHSHVWVDCMQLDGPFAAALSAATGNPVLEQFATSAILEHARLLQDERTGLFNHGFDDATGQTNGVHWGRGQGWALLGLVGVATHCRGSGPERREIVERLLAVVDALGRTSEDGGWHTVVDSTMTPVEHSVSAFCGLGVIRGIRAGLVPDDYRDLAIDAVKTARAHVQEDGRYIVSNATPVSSEIHAYVARDVGVFPWGQGPYVLLEAEAERTEWIHSPD